MIALLAILVSVTILLCLAGFVAWKISSSKCKQCTEHTKCKFHALSREHARLDLLNKKFRSKQCAERNQMNKKVKQLTDRITEMQAQLKDLTAAATPDKAIAGEVNDLTAKLAAARSAPDANDDKITGLEAQLAAANGALQASTANATKIVAIEAQIAAARNAPDANATKIAAMESELVAARGAIDAATVNATKIAAIEAQIIATRGAIEATTVNATKIAAIEAQIIAARGELSAASKLDLKRSNTLVAAMQKAQIKVMNEVVARDKIAIDKIAAIEANLAAARTAPEANATKIAEMQTQLTSAMQTAVRNVGLEMGADRDKIATIEKQLAAANGRIDADVLNIASVATKTADMQAQLKAARGFASLDATGLKVPQIKAHPQSYNAKMPNGWGGGIHSWDVYANATIAAGRDGSVAAYMNSAGDVMVGNKLIIGQNENSDPYFIEKVIAGDNRSSLRINIRDDKDESVQIWGDSCSTGDCKSAGKQSHTFRADGNTAHDGAVGVGTKDADLFGHTSGLHVRNGTIGWSHLGYKDGKNYLTGDTIVRSGKLQASQLQASQLAVDSEIKISQSGGKLCIGGTCITENDLKSLKLNISQDADAPLPGLTFQIMDGYFNDNVTYSGKVLHKGHASSIPNIFTGTNGIVVADGPMHRHTIEWTGFFRAQETGKHVFWLTSDDASYLWVGMTSGFTTANAVVNNKGLHGMQKATGAVNLVKGTSYPIRILYGENDGGHDCVFSFQTPGETETTNGEGFFFTTA
jgi:hypothetical protein